jgi:hypothetical protein
VLELDRLAAAADQLAERLRPVRLHVRAAGLLVRQAREVIGDDQVELGVGPGRAGGLSGKASCRGEWRRARARQGDLLRRSGCAAALTRPARDA